MDNYAKMLADAARRFLTYPWESLTREGAVWQDAGCLHTSFLGSPVRIDGTTGIAYSQKGNDWEKCDFCAGLSIYDYVCDRKSDAKASDMYCQIGSLPGVLVGGSGLSMTPSALAKRIHENPKAFQIACEKLGGTAISLGDMGYRLPVYPDLFMELKFYFSDEDFPPSLTLLWDRNILQFVRYETVYYIAGSLVDKLTSYIQPTGLI